MEKLRPETLQLGWCLKTDFQLPDFFLVSPSPSISDFLDGASNSISTIPQLCGGQRTAGAAKFLCPIARSWGAMP